MFTLDLANSERRLVHALAEMHEDEALLIARQLLLEPHCGAERMLECCRAAAAIVATRVDSGKYSLPELTLLDEMTDAIGGLVAGRLALGPAAALQSPGVTAHDGRGVRERFRAEAGKLQRIARHAHNGAEVRV